MPDLTIALPNVVRASVLTTFACPGSEPLPSNTRYATLGIVSTRESLKGHLDLLLLQVVAGAGSIHGYDIALRLRERSNGVFDLAEGTVYPALHRLEEQGLLGSQWDTSSARKRRMYSLTEAGAVRLTTGKSEWRRFARGVSTILGTT